MEKVFLLKVLILLSSIPSLIFATQIAKQNLCNHTPYPTICNSLVTDSIKYLPSSKQTNIKFRNVALLITLQNAQQVHRQISSMDFTSLDKLSKIAWEDCLELYEDTINQLNQTISSSSYNSITLDDIQTYLSASNTNHKTCQNGFLDLQVTSNSTLLTSNYMSQFSQLLSNVLAINGAILTSNNVVGGSNRRLLATNNPSWMSKTDHTLLESSMEAIKPDLVVAKDGSGNYKTISEAIAATKKIINGKNRFIIYIKGGIYKENIVVTNRMRNLMLIGDGIDVTIVSGNKNVQDGSTTFRSATFAISGDGFIAKGITFENTAGPQKHQAVALRSGSDFSIFYRCSFKGYQDTLYVYSKRQFYKECDIYGTVDFIFGNAAAIIQNCNIYIRKPMNNQQNTVTAQGRTDPNENTGIVIHNSIIEASSDLKPVQGSFRTFLGRPWQMYSRTIVMKCNIDRLIDHAGWAPWSGNFALKSLYYAEYMNSGAGSGTNGRVKWAGYHVITSPIEAGKFTVGKFLGGDNWIPATGVPFTSGL